MNETNWEALEHTSDIELLIRGHSEEELFINSISAILAQIAEAETVGEQNRLEITISAESREELFMDWLREILFLNLTRRFLVKKGESIELSAEGGYTVKAVVWGEKMDMEKHELLHEIKTVTYQDFFYGKKDGIWQARVVFDV